MIDGSSVIFLFLYSHIFDGFSCDEGPARFAVLSLSDRQSYAYIKQLQDRGYLLDLHPTDMPYRYDELRLALAGVVQYDFTGVHARWIHFLQDQIGLDDTERPVLDLRGASYLQVNNSERDHMYRPSDDIAYLWPMIELAPSIRYR